MAAWKTASGEEGNPIDHVQVFSIEIQVRSVVIWNGGFDKLYDKGAGQVGEKEGFGRKASVDQKQENDNGNDQKAIAQVCDVFEKMVAGWEVLGVDP